MRFKRIYILVWVLLHLFCAKLWAQLVNNGAVITVEQKGLLYVGGHAIYNSGTVFNHGEMVVMGNWTNNNANAKVFDNTSTGKVIFRANTGEFSGIGTTTFPELIFDNTGLYVMRTNIEARLLLDIYGIELQTQSNRLTLLNADPASLKLKGGFINTGTDGAFVRHTQAAADYIFPLGLGKGMLRFVNVIPNDAKSNAFAVSLIGRDPSLDGYSRLSKTASVSNIHDGYYFNLKRLSGSSEVQAIFSTVTSDVFTGLASWMDHKNWDKLSSVKLADNAMVNGSLSKSFNYGKANLPLAQAVPIAFAQITDAMPLEIYNAFSPDGDGKNDKWEVKNIDSYPNNDVKIFDRSGNLIFKMNNYNSSNFWDGQNATSGTYIYILRVNINGVDKYYKGAVTMVKN